MSRAGPSCTCWVTPVQRHLHFCEHNRAGAIQLIRKTSRRERVAELWAQGLGNAEIAERERCNRVTVWRLTKDMPGPPPPVLDIAPAPIQEGDVDARAPAGKLLAHDDLSLGVGVLRDRARSGSVTAARDLAKLSIGEIRAGTPCLAHVTTAEVHALMQMQFDLWRTRLLGPFARRLSLEFAVDSQAVEEMLENVVEDVSNEMNARRESAIAAHEGDG